MSDPAIQVRLDSPEIQIRLQPNPALQLTLSEQGPTGPPGPQGATGLNGSVAGTLPYSSITNLPTSYNAGAIAGYPLSAANPNPGDVLSWNGAAWISTPDTAGLIVDGGNF